jgi:hypothetical protein
MPGRLVFSTTADGASSPTERMRITSDAYVRLAAGTGGIQFNGDTAAANALDDYEEGTWTPVFSASGLTGQTYTSREGTYTKIGKLVTVWYEVVLSSKGTGGSGEAYINGLPFSLGISAQAPTVGGVSLRNPGTITGQYGHTGNQTALYIRSSLSDGSGAAWSNFADNTSIRGFAIYFVV